MLFRMAVAAGIAGMHIGCADLPDVNPDGCGNLVLNEGEDCDGFADQALGQGVACAAPGSANACHYTCDPAESETCPTGWGCGKDLRCRRPSGEFEEAPGSPWRFQVGDFAVGDVDGDGNADLIGNDVASVSVRFGSQSGEFASELDVVTSRPEGPLAFGGFDSDGLHDVVVPTATGLFVMLGQADRGFEPVAYSPFEIQVQGDDDFRAQPVEAGGDSLITELLLLTSASMSFVENTRPGGQALAYPDGFALATLAGRIPVWHLEANIVSPLAPPADPSRHEFALAFRGANSVCVYTSEGSVDDGTVRPVLRQCVGLPPGFQVQLGAQVADFNSDGWLDLLISVRDGVNQQRVVVALNQPTAGSGRRLEALAAVPTTLDGDSNVIDLFDGRFGSPWPLAAGYLNDDFTADYVFPDSVALSATGGCGGAGCVPVALVPTVFTPSAWGEAAIGDFNGDDKPDVVTALEGIDGVDVYLNAGFLFNRFHVDTENAPSELRVRDYDGDFIDDIAFAERSFAETPDTLSVIFGSSGGSPSSPISMGEFGTIESIAPLSSVQTFEDLDAIADLLVVSTSFPDGDTRAAALLRGNSSRRMLSPFSLQSIDDERPDIPHDVIMAEVTGDGVKDLISIAEPGIDIESSDGVNPALVPEAHLWVVPGKTGDGSLDASEAAFLPLPELETFNGFCASWVAGDLDTDTELVRDEFIGVDNNARCLPLGIASAPAPRIIIGRMTEDGPELAHMPDELFGSFRAVKQLQLADLDNDGDNDVLALFRGQLEREAGNGMLRTTGAGIVVLWTENGDVSSMTTLLEFTSQGQLFDVAAIHTDDDDTAELLILTARGVFLTEFQPDDVTYSDPELVVSFERGDGHLDVGDVNGDGVQDVAFTLGSDVHVFLQQPAPVLGSASLAAGDSL